MVMLLSFAANAQHKKQGYPVGSLDSSAGYSFKIFPAANATWGYDVFKAGRLIIHQPTLPALPGNEGFKDKAAATRIAKLAIRKMQGGQMPPTITPEELKQQKAVR